MGQLVKIPKPEFSGDFGGDLGWGRPDTNFWMDIQMLGGVNLLNAWPSEPFLKKSVQDAQTAGRKVVCIVSKIKMVKNCLVSEKNTPKTC